MLRSHAVDERAEDKTPSATSRKSKQVKGNKSGEIGPQFSFTIYIIFVEIYWVLNKNVLNFNGVIKSMLFNALTLVILQNEGKHMLFSGKTLFFCVQSAHRHVE